MADELLPRLTLLIAAMLASAGTIAAEIQPLPPTVAVIEALDAVPSETVASKNVLYPRKWQARLLEIQQAFARELIGADVVDDGVSTSSISQ